MKALESKGCVDEFPLFKAIDAIAFKGADPKTLLDVGAPPMHAHVHVHVRVRGHAHVHMHPQLTHVHGTCVQVGATKKYY